MTLSHEVAPHAAQVKGLPSIIRRSFASYRPAGRCSAVGMVQRMRASRLPGRAGPEGRHAAVRHGPAWPGMASSCTKKRVGAAALMAASMAALMKVVPA